MSFVVVIELVALSIFLYLCYTSVKYRNPYKLYMVFGKKGSGKTTLMAKLAIKYKKKGWQVFSDTEIPGCHCFDIKDFGNYSFPENSLVLIDEVGLIWDNRNFKSFPDHVKKYFKYQRQYRVTIYLFSQAFDIDKKIRDLTDHLYVVSNFFNCFSIARRVTKKLVVVHADKSAQGESKIVDDYNIDSLLLAPFGSVIVTYIPFWVKYFKSYNPPALEDIEYFDVPEVKLTPWQSFLRSMSVYSNTIRLFNKKKD